MSRFTVFTILFKGCLEGLFWSSWAWLVLHSRAHTSPMRVMVAPAHVSCPCLPASPCWACGSVNVCVSHVLRALLGCVTDERLKGASWVEETQLAGVGWGAHKGRWGKRPRCKYECVKMPWWLTLCANLKINNNKKPKILPCESGSVSVRRRNKLPRPAWFLCPWGSELEWSFQRSGTRGEMSCLAQRKAESFISTLWPQSRVVNRLGGIWEARTRCQPQS